MHSRIKLLAVALLLLLIPIPARAVQFGWQPLSDGGIEYQVQVEPELLDSFRAEGFTSDIPASLQRDLRRIRITVGNSKLPNEGDVIGPKDVSPGPTPARVTPTNSSTAPAAGSVPEKSNDLQTSPPPQPTPATQRPQKSSDSTFNDWNLPPPPSVSESPAKVESAPADPPRPLSSLPFFQSGQITKIDRGNSPVDTQIRTPRLNDNEGPPNDSRSFAPDHLSMAAKPAVLEAPIEAGKPSANSAVPATPKPWLPLMAALLALFASLGANVYLAWMHQGVRTKYRALVQRMGSSMAAI
jgi:hypothetical protein